MPSATERVSAMDVYEQAWQELGALEDGERQQQRFFGRPVVLPDYPGTSPIVPNPDVVTGYVDVSYDVSANGRVKNLSVLAEEIVSGDAESAEGKRVRLLRSLKRLLFRPKFEAGESVRAENIRERYAY